MTSEQMSEWASAYIEHYRDPDNKLADGPSWWAVAKFMIGYSEAASDEDCWFGILEILSRNPPNRVIEVLAAGPLEDLIAKRGERFMERIEDEARRNPAFRDLLGGVWQNRTPRDLWLRVEKARGNVVW